MPKRSGTLYVLCAKCGYFWVPRKKDKTARYRCPQCGSRETEKATAKEIVEGVRKKALEEFMELAQGLMVNEDA